MSAAATTTPPQSQAMGRSTCGETNRYQTAITAAWRHRVAVEPPRTPGGMHGTKTRTIPIPNPASFRGSSATISSRSLVVRTTLLPAQVPSPPPPSRAYRYEGMTIIPHHRRWKVIQLGLRDIRPGNPLFLKFYFPLACRYELICALRLSA